MTGKTRLLLAGLALLLAGWVIPADRVIGEIAQLRQKTPPLRVEALLESADPTLPTRVQLDLHPRHGVRVAGEGGGRWLLREGHLTQRGPSQRSAWLPEPELLALARSADLIAWLQAADVDLSRNELARCGESDCYVLGGRSGAAQLWVDKDRFSIWRFRAADGRVLHYEEYRDWDGELFPARIRVNDARGLVAQLTVTRVERAPELERADFSARWVEAPD